MARSLPSLLMVAAVWLVFVTMSLGLTVPLSLATNASQIACHSVGTYSGLCSREEREGYPTEVFWDISKDLFGQFQLMAQYSAAAYCSGNNNSPDTPITCPAQTCPLLEAAGVRSVDEFENTKGADDTGFIAVDETNRLIVLSFRGSRSGPNWFHDLNFRHMDTDLCPNCRVHRGFWTAWVEIRDAIKADVLQVLEAHPDFRFAITGHSLGGALATLAAGEIRKMNDDLGRRTELYSFGSPRLGDELTVDFLSKQSTLSYRITNRKDPVPRLPPSIFGFSHTLPEYYISHHSANPSVEDFHVYRGANNPEGNHATGSIFAFKKHKSYFTKNISACE